ncbi:amino acid adenylation domain-containing protein [Actinomyces wuliandei]|uniref:amino acid adenylation domain-containing protein n=1 Tax=Actinomyces wuliandei TaxID=2057743 RepID=UPI0011190AA4|nr:non-ribosomal peptide synthetase [Actinomyces wuliandei]
MSTALTPAQQGIWLSQQVLADESVYGVAEVTRIQGPLDTGAWLAAADRVLHDVPALRTRLVVKGRPGTGSPGHRSPDGVAPDLTVPVGAVGEADERQAPTAGEGLPRVVLDAVPASAGLVDLRQDPRGGQEAARQWVLQHLGEPIDLERGVVSRACLLLTGQDSAQWFLRVHHLALDGYGFALVGRALAREYSARLSSRGTRLPAAPARGGAAVGTDPGTEAGRSTGSPAGADPEAVGAYLEAVAQQAAYARSPQAKEDRAFWQGQAPGAPAVSMAPGGDPSRATHHPVEAPSTSAGADPAVLVAALAVLAGVVHRRDEAVVGVHVMNRSSQTLLRTPCHTQNVLPVRVSLDPDQSVGQLLTQVSQAWQRCREHQRYRHEDIRADRGLGVSEALCDVALNIVPFGGARRYGRARGRSEAVWEGPADGLVLDVRPGQPDGPMGLAAPAGSLSESALAGYARVLETLVSRLSRAAHGTGTPEVPEAERTGDADECLRDLLLSPEEPYPTGSPHALGLQALPPEPEEVVGLPDSGQARGATDPVWAVGALDRARLATSSRPRPPGSSQEHLCAPDRLLSYEETASCAHRLTRLLRELGVGAGDRVLLYLPRSSWMVLAPPAVLEAGAAFVPCDPQWPARRLSQVVEDVEPAVVVTTSALGQGPALRQALSQAGGTGARAPQTLVLDADSVRARMEALPAGPVAPGELDRPVRGEDAAYILFTSGSTGRPKGVVVEHRNLASYARAFDLLYVDRELVAAGRTGGAGQVGREGQPGSTAGAGSAQEGVVLSYSHVYSPAFDSALSPLVAFLHGHRLHVPTEEQLGDPVAHVRFLQDHAVDVIDLSPAVLEELLEVGLPVGGDRGSRGHAVTSLFIGGDTCSVPLWERLRQETRRGVFAANGYGPTENTVEATVAWVADHPEPSIGRSLPGQEARVLDHLGRALPPGVAGELYLCGSSVARGYLKDDDLTRSRFVTAADGSRCYRTGDLVRREPDGALTFMGRADSQLSLRGVRIEAAEVEAALVTQPGIRQAVVTVRDDGDGARLVGYVVPTQEQAPLDTAGVLDRLRDLLPPSFVPTTLVRLEALPLTERGKVDRSRLPAPGREVGAGLSWEQMDPDQQVVASVYAEVLDVPAHTLRSHTDLFAMGGHSLTAARVLGRLTQAGYQGLHLRDLFRDASVERVARLLGGTGPRPASATVPVAGGQPGGGAGSPEDAVPPVPASPVGEGWPLMTAAQRRLWFLEQEQGPSPVYAIPLVLDVAGHLDTRALEAAVVDTVLTYPALRTSYPVGEDGLPTVATWQEAAVREAVRLVVVDRDPHDPDLVGSLDTSIDVTAQPPVRAYLAQDADRQRLVLVIHHVAADGWSLRPVVDTLAAAYRARARDLGRQDPPDPGQDGTGRAVVPGPRPAPSPPASVSFPHVPPPTPSPLLPVAVPPAPLPAPAPEALSWWVERLRGLPEEVPLPLDRPRPRQRDHRGGQVRVSLGAERSAAVEDLARAHQASPFMVLHSVLAGLLTRCGAGYDIPIGTISSGRTDARREQEVGFLANTVVTRTSTEGNPSFTELLARVREDTLAVLEHAEVPFDAVVGAVNPRRDSSRHPLFQVMLVAQDTGGLSFDAGAGAPQVSVGVEGTGTSKFDLTWEVSFSEAAGRARRGAGCAADPPTASSLPVPTSLPGGSGSCGSERSASSMGEGISVRLEYATAVVDPATAQAMTRWFLRLLDQVLEDPRSRLWDRALEEKAREQALQEAARMLGARVALPEVTSPALRRASLGQALEAAMEEWAGREALTVPDELGVPGAGAPGAPGAQRLTYAALERVSARARDVLREAGAGPGRRVALLLGRRGVQVEVMVAVLRTGAAYVPLDPQYPEARLAAALEDCQPVVLVHDLPDLPDDLPDDLPVGVEGSPLPPGLRSALGPQTVVLSTRDLEGAGGGPPGQAPLLRRSPGEVAPPPSSAACADDPAYVIFTSGSTGRPKGVEVTQDNVLRLLRTTEHRLGLGTADVWTFFHSYAFDFSVWEVLGCLLTGGRLVVVPYEVSRSPEEMLALLEAEEVTVLSQTPSAFAQLAAADAQRDEAVAQEAQPGQVSQPGPGLRVVVLGGEAMDLDVVRRWFRRHPPGSPRVVNMYGITETTVHVTYLEVDEDTSGVSPVGRPLEDLAVYLLDEGGHPVPAGVVGEIHVGGAGVASGYVNQPGLSAERFLPDPFARAVLEGAGPDAGTGGLPGAAGGAGTRAAPAEAAGPGASGRAGQGRMYRSGDLAVRTRQGDLEFRGRADRQVQLRGFRVELGEVEARAREVEGVRLAYARVVQVRQGDERLVLYLTGPDPATADPALLRRQVARRLPGQMAPAAVVVLDRLALTVNGKRDDAALPVPQLPRSQGRAPATSTERLVCEHVARVLGIEECSAEDSFFDLGGHSMLAVSLVAALRKATGRPLRVGTVMTHPTPALLAAHLDEQDPERPGDTGLGVLLPLRPPDDRRPGNGQGPGTGLGGLFCVHPAGGLSWCYAGLPRHLDGLPVWGLQARGVLEPGSQPASLEEMARDYVTQVLQVQPSGPYHLVGWSLGGMVAHVMAVLLQEAGHQVGVLALMDAYPSEAATGAVEPPLADALSAVLAMAGIDDDVLAGHEEDLAAVVRALEERSSPMAGLERSVLEALVTTYRNTTRILREYQHRAYRGRALFLRAARGGIGPEHDPGEWDPYVTGGLQVVDVDCTHREMTQPGALGVIGPLLDRVIRSDTSP